MGTILASTIIAEMRPDLHDNSVPYRWSDTDLLSKLNNGQRFIVQHVPKANVSNLPWQLAAGVLQSIPTGGIELISIDFNMGTSGTVQGAPIRIISLDELNALIPDWTTATASATVQLYVFNEEDPTHFYVYPPQPASSQGYVRGPYSTSPADVAAVGSAITLNDIFKSPLKQYMFYECYRLETDALALQQAAAYYNACVTEIGRKDLIMKTYSPNRKQESA